MLSEHDALKFDASNRSRFIALTNIPASDQASTRKYDWKQYHRRCAAEPDIRVLWVCWVL